MLPLLACCVSLEYRPTVEMSYIMIMINEGCVHPFPVKVLIVVYFHIQPLTLVVALELAIQIATAMNYLADHSIVHPDLALRNCV